VTGKALVMRPRTDGIGSEMPVPFVPSVMVISPTSNAHTNVHKRLKALFAHRKASGSIVPRSVNPLPLDFGVAVKIRNDGPQCSIAKGGRTAASSRSSVGKFQHIDKMLRRIRGPVRAQPVNGIFSLRALAVQKIAAGV